jgi:hypothetical protein
MARDDCRTLGPEITALLDGELPGPAAAAVEAHLRACPACAGLARDLAGVGRALRAWDADDPAPPASAGFRARLLARTPSEGRAPALRAVPPAPAAPGRLLRLVPAAAAAAAVLAAGSAGWMLASARFDAGGPSVPAAVAPAAPPSARALLADAARHAAAGRDDLERRAVLAAWGTDPSDPEVRAALGRVLGFDPGALAAASPTPAEAPVPAAPAESPAGSPDAAAGGGGESLWIGPWRFGAPGAYDAFLAYRDRAREMEIASAAREQSVAAGSPTVAAPRSEPPEPDPLARLVASLEVGHGVGGGGGGGAPRGLVLYPLRSPGGLPGAPDLLDLPGALAARRAEVHETPGRSPSSVLVSNLDPSRPLLLLAGEVLDGGRADRMVARDLVVPPGARRVPVAVVPVEAGRESAHPYGSRFRTVAGVAGSRLRGLALGQASADAIAGFLRGRLDMLDVTGLRRSLSDAYSDRGPASPVLRALRPRVAELLRGLEDESVVGFAVAQGRAVLAFEVFGSHALLRREAPRILEGCELESSTYAADGLPPDRDAVAALLAAAAGGSSFQGAGDFPEVGLLAREGGLLGSGVAHRGAVLHAALVAGAGSGVLAGRGSQPGDFPGGGGPPAGAGGAAGGTGPSGGGGSGPGGSDGPSDTSGGGESRPPDAPPTERPR